MTRIILKLTDHICVNLLYLCHSCSIISVNKLILFNPEFCLILSDTEIFMSQLTIYRASAGSGKTYKLTEEYLLLLFWNPLNYRRILAVTFTNKATAEMKGRILKELYNLSVGNESGYLELLKKTFKLTGTEVQQKAEQILALILHDFSKFSVSTIDTFFQKIIRSFTREVGIQPGYTVELEHGEILNKVIDELLLEIDANNELRDWLVSFASSNIEEGSKWDFKSDIFKLAQEIFKEEYKAFDKELIEKMSDKSFLKNYLNELQAIKVKFENTLVTYGKEGLQLIENFGLTLDDFSYGKSGVPGYFVKIAEKTEFEPKTRTLSGLESFDPWIKKNSPKADIIEDALHNGLFEQLSKAVNFYNENYVDYYTSLQIVKYIYTLGILTDIAIKLRNYCNEQGVFLISDAAKLLQLIIDENETPFIYEKTGSIYKHFMIDEFQDTSHIQWHNFKPLIGNSLSEGNTNLLVGDVKQSIYRWRNSDWKILAENVNSDFGGFEINSQSLSVNWRSRKNIISYNNSIFLHAAQVLQQKFNEAAEGSNEFENKIITAYSDIIQQSPTHRPNEGGFVKHCFITKTEEDEHWKEEVKKRLPAILEELQDKGFQLKDIAVLVRKGSEGQEIAEKLIEYKQSQPESTKYRYDFISNDSLFLTNSVVVPILISTLNFLLNEDDNINTSYLIWSYQKNIAQKTSNIYEFHELIKNSSKSEKEARLKKFLPEKFIESTGLLKQMPLFELTDRIIQLLDLHKLNKDSPYLQAFQDIILNFGRNKSADIHSFIEWWNEKGNQQTLKISENQDAIRILTVHKSKGLEFKAVVIPFCNWEIDHKSQPANILWCKPDRAPFNKLELVPVKYEQKLNKTIFASYYLNEKMHAFIDNLNLLYVAFTRAEQALFTFSPYKENMKSISNVGDLLQFIYTNVQDFQNKEIDKTINFSEFYNSTDYEFTFGELYNYSSKPIEQVEEIIPENYQSFDITSKLRIKLHDNSFFTGKENTAYERVNHGKIMHNIFEKILTENDIPKAIEQLISEGKLSSKDKETILGKINDQFKNEQVKSWFSDKWKIKTEQEIVLKGGKVVRPDRVLIGKDKIIVIDFKFGEQEEEKHYTQVKNYIEILQQMENKAVEGYLWYVDRGIVREV